MTGPTRPGSVSGTLNSQPSTINSQLSTLNHQLSTNQGGLVLIFKGPINFCWLIFKWGLLLGVIGVIVAVPYFYHRVDEEIRRRVEAKFARHYADLKVMVRSAELVEGEGIEVRGLSILELGAEGPRAELLHLEEVFLACRTELNELVNQELEITHITIRRPTLRITHRPDGSWSTAKLLPLPKLSRHPPAVTIENGTIEIFDPLKNPAGTLMLRDVNLSISAPEAAEFGPDTRTLKGALTGDYLRQVELKGMVDPIAERWDVSGHIERLEISPEFRAALPAAIADKLTALGTLRGEGNIEFRVSDNPSGDSPYLFDLSGRLARGRMADPRLPYPLTEMRAKVHLDNEGFTIEQLSANSGQATLRLSCRRTGYDESSPLALEAEIRQLELDRQLLDMLPKEIQDQWYKYLPAGHVHADVKLSYDGRNWQPDLAVRCLDVSFTYHKFPYRLEHGKGTLELKDDVLRVNLTAVSGSQPVRLSAEVHHPNSNPFGWFEAKGDNLPLDKKLLTALPEKPRAVIRSLEPRGTANFFMRAWRDAPNTPMHSHLLVGLNRCSMRYEKFPYPLNNIRGTVEILDGRWTFRDFEGVNDSGFVTCEGHLVPTPQGNELVLRLSGTQIELEEELRDALRPNMQQLWNRLKPRGVVHLGAEVRYLANRKQLNVVVRLQPHGDSMSIEPVAFPYALEKLQGTAVYRDGHVTLKQFKAEHGNVKLSASGYTDLLPDGGWRLHLEGLSVDRLRLDRELMQALPGRLRKPLIELDPRGPINLHGTIDFSRGGQPGAPLCSKWDLAIGFNQGSIDCGVKLENLQGGLTLVGQFDGQNFHSRGELAVDSLTYKDIQLTQVMGPIWIDDRRVLLGSWVDRPSSSAPSSGTPSSDAAGQARPQPSQQPRTITAKLFGGIVYGDGWVALEQVPRYGLHATLAQADLTRCAQEVMMGRQNLRGKIMATVDLRGSGRSINTLGGHGRIQLREADIYELPLMISLLKILSIRPPDTTAFSKSDIDFRIEGNHIYFDRIDFNGDAISLLGKGEMNFQSDINLNFHTVVGRHEWRIPVLSELVGGASQQIMLIHVGGSLKHPKTSKEAFPGVSKALQQLQADLQRPVDPPALFPQARQWMPKPGRR